MENPVARKRLRRGKKSHRKETNPHGKRKLQDSGVDEFASLNTYDEYEPIILCPDERSESE